MKKTIISTLFFANLLSACNFNYEEFMIGYNYGTTKSATQNDTDKSSAVAQNTNDTLIYESTKDVIARQEKLTNLYKENFSSLDGPPQRLLFMNLSTPLGVFDPFDNPQNIDVKAISNRLFGYQSKEYEFELEDAESMAETPIRDGDLNFDAQSFYSLYYPELENLAIQIMNQEQLFIAADFGNKILRYNDYFVDLFKNIYWKVESNNENFYTKYQDPMPIESMDSELSELQHTAAPYLVSMVNMEIQSFYKCDDKIIMTINGAANNAYGFIYNAQNPEDVNCGRMSNRFRIHKSQKLDDKWIYWVGK